MKCGKCRKEVASLHSISGYCDACEKERKGEAKQVVESAAQEIRDVLYDIAKSVIKDKRLLYAYKKVYIDPVPKTKEEVEAWIRAKEEYKEKIKSDEVKEDKPKSLGGN